VTQYCHGFERRIAALRVPPEIPPLEAAASKIGISAANRDARGPTVSPAGLSTGGVAGRRRRD